MEFAWIATDRRSLRTSGLEQRSSRGSYLARMNELMDRGEGYTEVRCADRDHPVLTLGFRERRAVVHCFTDQEVVSLLRAPGRSADGRATSLPSIDGDVEFAGEFVMSVEDAWSAVAEFLETSSVEGIGEWVDL